MRQKWLKSMNKVYVTKEPFPIATLQQRLCFDTEAETVSFAEHYGMQVLQPATYHATIPGGVSVQEPCVAFKAAPFITPQKDGIEQVRIESLDPEGRCRAGKTRVVGSRRTVSSRYSRYSMDSSTALHALHSLYPLHVLY
jgi:hypothetical protein